jgi:glycosyltransferase involved in cell wall biosynthesis
VTEPDVSLVLAAFAPRPDWLRAAVSSALAQTGCTIEVVVVDDGSPQPAAEILQDIGDARLRVMQIEHSGVSGARNEGIAVSRGRYLRFIDADDVYPLDSTSRLFQVAQRGPEIVACGTTRWCRDDLEPIFDWPVRWRGDAVSALLLMRCTISAGAKLLPRTLAEAAGPWRTDLTIGEDLDYQIRLLEHGQLAVTKQVVSWYRQHPDSNSRDGAVAYRDCARLVQSYFDRHPEQGGTRLERQARAALGLLAAEIERSPQGPWRDRRFWGALARDPSALALVYERQAQPRLSRAKMLMQLARRSARRPRRSLD